MTSFETALLWSIILTTLVAFSFIIAFVIRYVPDVAISCNFQFWSALKISLTYLKLLKSKMFIVRDYFSDCIDAFLIFLDKVKNKISQNSKIKMIKGMSTTNQIVVLFFFAVLFVIEVKLLIRFQPTSDGLYSISFHPIYWHIRRFIRLQIFSILLVISPLCEILFRFINGCRGILTNEEKERALNNFAEVQESYASKDDYLQGVQIYVDDSIMVNAYAVGLRTIVVTRGALYGLSDTQLKGVLAHEFGHIKNGDTFVSQILLACTGIGIFMLFIIKLLSLIIDGIIGLFSKNYKNSRLKGFLFAIIYLVYFVITSIINLMILAHKRASEYEADHTAHDYGYGAGLISALYYLSNTDLKERNASLTERIRATHPNIFLRIASLEKLD